MSTIQFDEITKVRGMGPESSFSATVQTISHPYASGSGLLEVPEYKVYYLYPAGSRNFNTVVINGNEEGLRITTSDPTGTVFVEDKKILSSKFTDYYSSPGSSTINAFITTDFGTVKCPFTFISNGANGKENALISFTHYLSDPEFTIGSVNQEAFYNISYLFEDVAVGADRLDMHLDGSDYTVFPPVLVKNPNFVLKDIDMSWFNVYHNGNTGMSGKPQTFVLVSPRHAVVSTHILATSYTTGEVGFQRLDGSFQKVTVQDIMFSEVEYPGDNSDWAVVYFDEDVTGCTPIRTLPASWKQYIPSADEREVGTVDSRAMLPVIMMTANVGLEPSSQINTNSRHARIAWAIRLNSLTQDTIGWRGVPNSSFALFGATVYGGDSGSPVITLLGGIHNLEPVLISTIYSTSTGSSYPSAIDRVNDFMSTLSIRNGDARQFQLETVDLSRFKVLKN